MAKDGENAQKVKVKQSSIIRKEMKEKQMKNHQFIAVHLKLMFVNYNIKVSIQNQLRT